MGDFMSINPDIFLNNQSEPAAYLYDWLRQSSSITEKLLHQSGDANIRVLNQSFRKTGWWDHYSLGLNHDDVFVREILMLSHHKPCWYAKTIVPNKTYQSHLELFKQLQTGSLTRLIYDNPQVQRHDLIHYPVFNHTMEWHWVFNHVLNLEHSLWARLSSYVIQNHHPFYLLEVFLPALQEVCHES